MSSILRKKGGEHLFWPGKLPGSGQDFKSHTPFSGLHPHYVGTGRLLPSHATVRPEAFNEFCLQTPDFCVRLSRLSRQSSYRIKSKWLYYKLFPIACLCCKVSDITSLPPLPIPSLLPTVPLLTSCLYELLLYFNLPSPLSAAWMCMGTGFSNKSMGSLLGAAICGLFPSPLGCQLPIASFSARCGTWNSQSHPGLDFVAFLLPGASTRCSSCCEFACAAALLCPENTFAVIHYLCFL